MGMQILILGFKGLKKRTNIAPNAKSLLNYLLPYLKDGFLWP